MKPLCILLSLCAVAGADALMVRAPYTRPQGVNANLWGVVLLDDSNNATRANLLWHGDGHQIVGDVTGRWDGTELLVSGLGCNVELPGACHPYVPMVYSSTDGLAVDGVPTGWELQSFSAEVRPIGDSTGDGVFDSLDMVTVMQHGRYENNHHPDGSWNELGQLDATWNHGDWNLDREFDSADMIAAFQAGSYGSAAVVVPEPSALLLVLCGIVSAVGLARSRRDG